MAAISPIKIQVFFLEAGFCSNLQGMPLLFWNYLHMIILTYYVFFRYIRKMFTAILQLYNLLM